MPRGKKGKTVKKGGYYGFGKPIGPGSVEWTSGSEVVPEVANRAGNGTSGGRRRKTVRKGRKGSKKRKMRGGTKFASVGHGFTGRGINGMGTHAAYSPRGAVGSSTHGAFNDGGAHSGNFSSFGGLLPK